MDLWEKSLLNRKLFHCLCFGGSPFLDLTSYVTDFKSSYKTFLKEEIEGSKVTGIKFYLYYGTPNAMNTVITKQLFIFKVDGKNYSFDGETKNIQVYEGSC